jgi:hypothetical protein
MTYKGVFAQIANEDMSLGSWFIGLEVNHIDEKNMCCGTPSGLEMAMGLDPRFSAGNSSIRG